MYIDSHGILHFTNVPTSSDYRLFIRKRPKRDLYLKLSNNYDDFIKEASKKYGISFRGPIPLPTKKLKVPVMRTPCGSGTGHGNATWDKYEMRIHKRILDIGANERFLHQIMRMNLSSDVQLSIELKD